MLHRHLPPLWAGCWPRLQSCRHTGRVWVTGTIGKILKTRPWFPEHPARLLFFTSLTFDNLLGTSCSSRTVPAYLFYSIWWALPLSPITPRAPATGGGALLFKLMELIHLPSTMVSPGRARFPTLSYFRPPFFSGASATFVSGGSAAFFSAPFASDFGSKALIPFPYHLKKALILSSITHLSWGRVLTPITVMVPHGTGGETGKYIKNPAMISRAPCLKKTKGLKGTPSWGLWALLLDLSSGLV